MKWVQPTVGHKWAKRFRLNRTFRTSASASRGLLMRSDTRVLRQIAYFIVVQVDVLVLPIVYFSCLLQVAAHHALFFTVQFCVLYFLFQFLVSFTNHKLFSYVTLTHEVKNRSWFAGVFSLLLRNPSPH